MPLERRRALAPGDHVPELHHPVAAGGGHGLAVGREGDRAHRGRVAGEAGDLLRRGHVPELHQLVVARRGQRLAVGGERHGQDPVLVSLERSPSRCRRRRPRAGRSCRSWPRPGSDRRGERQAGDDVGVAGQGLEHVAGRGIAEGDRLVLARLGEQAAVGRIGQRQGHRGRMEVWRRTGGPLDERARAAAGSRHRPRCPDPLLRFGFNAASIDGGRRVGKLGDIPDPDVRARSKAAVARSLPSGENEASRISFP